ncbi:MAG TPA: hypothetical protein VND90_00130 [Terracidiphilus sp.]|nr:hypothetical protein [Terracidiphilus sp.]
MGKISRMVLGAAMTAALSVTLAAQQAPVGFHTITCVKANAGKGAALGAWVADVGPKWDKALVESGRARGTIVLRAEMPQGKDAACDYAFVTFYSGLPPAPMTPAETTELLKKSGIQMTLAELGQKESDLATLVYTNITQYQTLVGGAKEGDYLVFNSIDPADANACVAYEQKEWKPLAEEMVKAGGQEGWALNEQVFPRGDKDGPAVSTVDIYPSWDAFLHHGQSISDAWKKVNGDAKIDDAMGQFEKLCPIEHTQLYKVTEANMPQN